MLFIEINQCNSDADLKRILHVELFSYSKRVNKSHFHIFPASDGFVSRLTFSTSNFNVPRLRTPTLCSAARKASKTIGNGGNDTAEAAASGMASGPGAMGAALLGRNNNMIYKYTDMILFVSVYNIQIQTVRY